MLRRAILIALFAAGGAALFFIQRNKVTTEITPRPALYLVAGAEREAERLPLEFTRVSDQEEMRVGQQMSRSVCNRIWQSGNPNFDASRIQSYVTTVGSNVALHVQRQRIRYIFCVDQSPYFVNAYALPGGYVIIGRGLLSRLESEDELAFILGHEIAHVDDRHAIERVQYRLASRKLGLESVYQLGSPAQVLYESGYTKEQEQEADRDGITLAHQAGYSAKGALDAMQRFEKMEHDMHSAAGSPLEEFANIPLASLKEISARTRHQPSAAKP